MKIKEYLELNEKIKESRKNLFKSNSKVNRKLKKQEMNRLMTRKPDDKGAEVAERPVKKFQKSKQESELQFLTRIDKVLNDYKLCKLDLVSLLKIINRTVKKTITIINIT